LRGALGRKTKEQLGLKGKKHKGVGDWENALTKRNASYRIRGKRKRGDKKRLFSYATGS